MNSPASPPTQPAAPVATPAARSAAYARVNAPPAPDASAEQDRLARAAALLELGLVGPARSLAPAVADWRSAPRYAALAPRLNGPSGKRSWARYRARFDANLAVLAARGADVAAIRAAWAERGAAFELYSDIYGVDHVLRRAPGGAAVFVACVQDHAAAVELAAPPPDARDLMPGPYLFDGIELGWLLERTWRRTRNTFHGYCSALYLVEPDEAALAMALHLHDFAALLGDESVLLFAGQAAAARFAAALRADHDLPIPAYQFTLAGARAAGPLALIDLVRQVGRERQDAAGESWRALEVEYAARDATYHAARFASALSGGPPLRVLARVGLHTSFLKYSMRDAQRALERRGCVVRVLIERRPFERIHDLSFHAALREFRPDLVLALDHPRASFVGRIPTNLPLLTWDQDNLPHLFNEETMKQLGPLDVVVGLPKLQLIARCGLDPRQFLAAPMATSPDEFAVGSLPAADPAAHACDVSFVSHASQTPEEFHREQLAQYPAPEMKQLLAALLVGAREYTRTRGGADGRACEALLRAAEQEVGIRVLAGQTRLHLLNWHIWRLCDRLFRHEALEWVADWARRTGRRFRIYGNGWERHPTLAPFAAGAAQNGAQLACIYRASAINLQLMPAGFLHQRALDGLCAGGFFLTRASRGDRGDARLQALHRALDDAGIGRAAELSPGTHGELAGALAQVGRDFDIPPDEPEHALQFVRLHGTWPYPADVLPDFDQITFADAASFAAAAERFLAQPHERVRLAERMRAAVIARFSYDALCDRFLRFHAGWLALQGGQALPEQQPAAAHQAGCVAGPI